MYIVSFNSAGCLPDNEVLEFDCIDNAADYILTEYMDCIDGLGLADTGFLPDTDYIKLHRQLEYPVPSSLYSWSIDTV